MHCDINNPHRYNPGCPVPVGSPRGGTMVYWLVWKGSGLSRHRSPVFRGAYPADLLAGGVRLGEQG